MSSIRSVNPASPADVVGEWPVASATEVKQAVARALAASAEWAEVGALERAALLGQAGDVLAGARVEVADLVVREVGKPVDEALAEVDRATRIFRYYAQVALLPHGDVMPSRAGKSVLLSCSRPLGVVGLITPWNFPVAIPIWKLAPCLAFGNVAVMKPSELSMAVAIRLHELIGPIFPRGVFQIVVGDGASGATLVEAEGISGVSFTGSRTVGESVIARCAGRGVPVQAEMGGQNPAIVLDDADVDRAVRDVTYSVVGYSGQKCTATRRVVVVKTVYKEFIEGLLERIRSARIGDPRVSGIVGGPLISGEACVRAERALKASAGRTLVSGQRMDCEGYFFSPAVVAVAGPDDVLACDEVFAPVVAVLEAGSVEDALDWANATEYGLVAGLYTKDIGRTLGVSSGLRVGVVKVNGPTAGVEYQAPFGGWKHSGFGPREQGLEARQFFTQTQTVVMSAPE